MKRYLGVDLHKTKFTVCYLHLDGHKELLEFNLTKLEDFKKTLQSEDEVAVEATSNCRFFCQSIADHVMEVKIVHPGQFLVISQSTKKTDRQDAEQLAFFLSKGMLPEARVMSQQRARLKSLVGTRDRLVKLRTALKNKIHNILSAQGTPLSKTALNHLRGLQKALVLAADELTRFEINLLVEQIQHLNEGIQKVEQELQKPENQLPGHANLTSIKGIGDVGSTVLLSVIGDIRDFPDSKHLASYLGLVPRVRQSSEREIHGRITKKGNKLGRTILVQCTWTAIRYNPRMKEFYLRIKSRGGSGKAIIATARKFLGIIYYTLVNEIIWEDFPNGIIASSIESKAA